ncbi:hypothetical protein GLOIN_2v1778859 [Rhizophagus clarus]|uniref:Uncharacterized protein n=1 Tax=Rhizophagus clarus TaxID=94130 RepID=A0A8H3LFG9_9GLOM|nr:hypothetical protein GLOIN_2v1778859 [Rhizophagus clarus]
MEGVENINSVNTEGTSTASTEELYAGLEASIHAQAQTATTTTVTSNLVLGQNDTEKKNHAFCHIVGLAHIFLTTTIKGVKIIKVVCETEDATNKVMTKPIMVNNSTKFSNIESFTQNQSNLESDFEIKI